MTRVLDNSFPVNPPIGGLLLLVGFSIFMDIFFDIRVLFSIDWGTFSVIGFKTLATTTKSSLLYDTRLWILEIITGCVSAYLFLKKKKLFVNWFILLIVLDIIFQIFDINISKDAMNQFTEYEMKLHNYIEHFYLPIMIFSYSLFILYLVKSKRVKATFTQ